ncbi:unnamed protein product [Gongylonema pulchrum]|uniref:Endoplasmic reticulum transmembrane protein n=1 Tax=Gongylonema pulchrum TaxID=637853 RepID=A0A183DX80_9BILA|nr:unnamed protein product [Gongylonema pulchrum]
MFRVIPVSTKSVRDVVLDIGVSDFDGTGSFQFIEYSKRFLIISVGIGIVLPVYCVLKFRDGKAEACTKLKEMVALAAKEFTLTNCLDVLRTKMNNLKAELCTCSTQILKQLEEVRIRRNQLLGASEGQSFLLVYFFWFIFRPFCASYRCQAL